jgi:hypothetical protein
MKLLNCIRLSLLLLTAGLSVPAVTFGASTLYWLDTNHGAPRLGRSDLSGLGVTTINLPAGTLPEGLAAWADGRITWTEAAWANARIMGSAYDLSNATTVVSGGSALRGVAVDDVNHVLYWVSSNLVTGAAIHRKTLNGPATVILNLPAGANPRGLAVDPAAGKIFWADCDLDRIHSANLDGTGMTLLVPLVNGTRPWGVAVYRPSQQLYWTEYTTGRLVRSSYTGTGVTTIHTGLPNPTYLAVDGTGTMLFWTEGAAGSQRIRRSFSDGTGLQTLPPPLSTYGGIAVGPATTSAVDEPRPAADIVLHAPWPNPGPGRIHLAFSLPVETRVRLSIFDVLGREVAVLKDGVMPSGRHEVLWDGLSRGNEVSAGVYFSRLSAGGKTQVERFVLSR